MRRGAFNLLELIMVLVVMALLSMMAAPRYASFAAQQQLANAERRLLADLSLAQRRARQNSASQTVSFDVAAGKYSLVGMSDPDHPSQPFDVRLGDEPYRARIVSATFNGDASVIYDGYGAPDSGGTVVLAVGNYQTTVEVNASTGKPQRAVAMDPPLQIE